MDTELIAGIRAIASIEMGSADTLVAAKEVRSMSEEQITFDRMLVSFRYEIWAGQILTE
jgi:hypothetical protein